MHDDTQREAGADGQGRLDVEEPLGQARAGAADGALQGFAQGPDQFGLTLAQGQLGADAKQGGQHDTRRQTVDVIVNAVFQPGVSGRVGGRQVVDLDRRAVRHDDPVPDDQGAGLPEGDDAVVGADQARSLRDQHAPGP